MPATRLRLGRAIVSVLVVACVAIVELPAHRGPVVSADALPPLGIIVRGHGNGHGRGMSQYGAFGWATKMGAGWQDILNFYYGGSGRSISALMPTDSGASNGWNLSVRLQTLDDSQTAVISDNGSASWGGRADKYAALVARPAGTNTFDIYGSSSARCASATSTPSGFTLLAKSVKGPIDFTTTKGAQPAAVAPGELIGVCEPSSSTSNSRVRFYRGVIRATVDGNGARRTVNIVQIESYLRGVVPRESPAGWGDAAGGAGMNALRAQAVAARTYALSEARYSYAKTCDTQDCQVYGGAAMRSITSLATTVLEDSRTDRAITDTAGVVIRDANARFVRTEFTSSNGGRTAGGVFPVQIDNGDLIADALLQSWSRLISADDLQNKYPSIGALLSVSTTHDGFGGDWNGYATSVVISGTAGSVTRTAWQFRGDWDLYAPWFETFHVPPADPAAAPVGNILYIGDSVSESIATEFSTFVTPAYPSMTFHACTGRGMAGSDCLFPVAAPQVDLDGVGIVAASPAPAVAIVALGYNDDPNSFNAEVQQMLSALSSKAVQRVIFVNMSTRSSTRNYAKSNAAFVSAASNPAVTVLDWNAASSAPNQWRWFDNDSGLCCWVHLNTSGQAEFTMFLRQQLDLLRSQGLLPTTAPASPIIPGLPLAISHRGVMVKSLQKKLNAVLKLRGPARLVTDGDFGSGTKRVVKKFQRSVGLPATGSVDRATWDALGLSDRGDLAILQIGTRHPAVSVVQRALAKALRKPLDATGLFTNSLADDVKTFQKRAGLRASGRVGPTTWSVLMLAAANTK